MYIPNGWKKVRLEEVASFKYGRALLKKDKEDGDIPIYGSNGIIGYNNKCFVEGPGIIIGRKGTVGSINISQKPFWPIDTTFYVEINTKEKNLRFIYYLLKICAFDNSDGTVPGLNRYNAHSKIVILPPLSEQRAIADILVTADRLISLKEQLIDAKRKQKLWLMQKLLTRKIRLKGFDGEWKEVKLGRLLKVKYGKDQKTIESNDGKYPILGTGGIIGRTNTALYSKPSVLIGRKGSIDRPYYMDTPFWTIDTLFYTEIINTVSPKYIYYYFCIVDWRKLDESTGVPSLSATAILNVKISLPPIPEQSAIAAVLATADKELELLACELEQQKLIKKYLMQQLLTGRIRVKGANL
jgi:type I restriction enzyme S subunit